MRDVQWHAEFAWLGDEVAAEVLIETAGPRIRAVTAGTAAPAGAVRLPGLTLPGLANAHSHAFHRALRGRAQGGAGDFWTWRDRMFAVAGRLSPDSYRTLARAVYAEMALAGITCVGEFHYLHHQPDGTPYPDPNAMGEALIAAAADAGIRITLLDACYLTGAIGEPLAGVQLRFGDGTALRWAKRVSALKPRRHARIGAAIHSVRAVPREQISVVADWATVHHAPLHVHLSEQPAENAACMDAYGRTPTRLLVEGRALGPRTVAVHATHLTDDDIMLLGGSDTGVCMCPTTERDLADGIGRAADLHRAGSQLSLGSDQHAVIDLFEEARGMELDERLRTGRRGHWSPGDLLTAATEAGHFALGWPAGGRLEPGAHADLVTVALDSVRTAGIDPAQVVYAASAADVRSVVASGRQIVRAGEHLLVPDVPAALAEAVAALHPEGMP